MVEDSRMGLESLCSRGLWQEAYSMCMRLRAAGFDVDEETVLDICMHVEGVIAYRTGSKNCCVRIPMEGT